MRAILPVIFAITICACGPRHPARNIPAPPPTPQRGQPQVADVQPPMPTPPSPVDKAPREEKTEAAVAPPRSLGDILQETAASLRDMFFDYDRFDLAAEALAAARHNADLLASVLAAFREVEVTIEGHCDERGSAEYNLALGDRRASSAAVALVELGVPRAKLQTISYGKEMPQCLEASESCWKRNRRAHLVLRPASPSSGIRSESLSQLTTGTATPSPNR